jgi:hypothetical protein
VFLGIILAGQAGLLVSVKRVSSLRAGYNNLSRGTFVLGFSFAVTAPHEAFEVIERVQNTGECSTNDAYGRLSMNGVIGVGPDRPSAHWNPSTFGILNETDT